MNKDYLISLYPEATNRQLKAAIKYQDKFNLTYENLKCLNPDCNHMRKWSTSDLKFRYCCSKECTISMQSIIKYNAGKKAQETYFKNTGFESTMHNPEAVKKYKQTSIQNNGVENIFFKKNYIDKKRLKKIGYLYPIQNPEIKEKIKQTCLKKYGFENPGEIHLKNFENWDNKEFWINNFITIDDNFNYISCMEYFNCKQPGAHNQIKKLNIEYSKLGGTSLKEQVIVNYLKKYYDLTIIQNDRSIIKPNEVDIYLPELQLAIEYNGLYWHSYHQTIYTCDKQSDLEYMIYRHQQKALACLEQGIRLLHLYEDQTNEQQFELIDKFLINEYDIEATTFNLNNGCYPNNIEVEILEPEARTVCSNRTLWDAGQIKIKDIYE